MTERKLNWGTLRKKISLGQNISIKGNFLSFQKCHFLDMSQKN
jgi:hypothetical protein